MKTREQILEVADAYFVMVGPAVVSVCVDPVEAAYDASRVGGRVLAVFTMERDDPHPIDLRKLFRRDD